MSNSISTLLLRNLSDVFGENDSVRLHPGEGAEDGGAEGLTARNTRVGTGAFARSPELSRPELLSDYLCHLAASDQL
jgi:hypothetical protein